MEKQFKYVKPFLIMINALPDVLYNVGKYDKIYTDTILMDDGVIRALRKIGLETR